MRQKKVAYLALLLFLLPVVATASPEEACGTVVGVIDGKTFEVSIEKTDPRIVRDVERVTLADLEVRDELMDESMKGSENVKLIDSMNESMSQPLNWSEDGSLIATINESQMESTNESMNGSNREGPSAKDLAVAILLNKTVWLDIDNRSEDGRNSDGELVAVLYLSGLDGKPVVSPSFNRMLIDYRMADLNDSLDNEFDPADWWPAQNNDSSENESEAEDAGTKTTGLNVDINPAKPNVDVNIDRLKIDINPAKPNVNVSLSELNIEVNPTKPSINVDPTKPAVDVEASESNETEKGGDDAVSYYDTMKSADVSAPPSSNRSEPIVLENSTVPITLINPTGNITVINSTGQVTLIDPALAVKLVNSSDLASSANVTEAEPAAEIESTTSTKMADA